ncbi:carboxypeptidase-like regulatory domain-containing protein [Mucilaginibacter dorajii]|uniref:Carboxypeptidase-like regulatory domain-containing protein n=1 Tax=Mucilaginibacter dorajii TaxID=692994 RepID=A0ABP7Q741_9SPHI|nr:carboxypeptidase-like regulatory domain-containing protein [Mucilaginibacter dorajii]MCS3737543.1 hypothetical protein [Mucilaginibacter dorajii]
MRYLMILVLLCFCLEGYGQKISGIVTDKNTGQRISGAWITTSNGTTISNMAGEFAVNASKLKDTLKVKMQGYKLYVLPVDASKVNTVAVALQQTAIELNQVNISARRDRVKDSISNRKDFAKDFASRPPKFSDIVRPSLGAGPYPMAGVTIVPSQLIALLTYKHSNAYKLKKALIAHEQGEYIDSRFSDERVAQLTNLPDDSLHQFIELYRPAIAQVKKMSDYDIMTYIKTSLVKYKSPVHHALITEAF